MTSHTTKLFWKLYGDLPEHVRRQAKTSYRRFQQDPFRAGLQFKQVHEVKPIYSVRISRDYRAVGVKDGEEIIWFWVGSHADYDKLLLKL